MVLSYPPQLANSSIPVSTIYPPQISGRFRIIPPLLGDQEAVEEVATVIDNLIYNETGGGDDGQVEVEEM